LKLWLRLDVNRVVYFFLWIWINQTRAHAHIDHTQLYAQTHVQTHNTPHVKLKYIVLRIEILPFFHSNSFYWRASTAICRKEQKCFKFLIYVSIYLSIYISIYLSIYLSIYIYIHNTACAPWSLKPPLSRIFGSQGEQEKVLKECISMERTELDFSGNYEKSKNRLLTIRLNIY